MKLLLSFYKVLLLLILFFSFKSIEAQFLMDMIDTSKDMGKGMLGIYKRFDRVSIGGYIQPQFQSIQTKGGASYNGGDFAQYSNNRFMLRRGRIRFDYVHFGEEKKPSLQFVFQFDGTERGVFIRDFWGRIFENRWKLFSFAMGMFARPFGYELNLSSADRESPERGRMSQILMRTERDLGAMITLDDRKKVNALKYLKIDMGIFNGQGLTAPGEFDSYKDFIVRVALKPYSFSDKVIISIGSSYLNGGFAENSRFVYHTESVNGTKTFIVDSSQSNKGQKAKRQYNGFDAQIKFIHDWGLTELRAEYWWGTQTASANSSETPAVLLTAQEGYYIRRFNGAFFYLLQNIINNKHQLGVKFDWYDPNTKVSGLEIGKAGSNMNASNIKYSTLSVGYNRYISDNLKLMLWYDIVNNETTQSAGYTRDIKDNVITCRLQFRF